jgi:hypothetical protein
LNLPPDKLAHGSFVERKVTPEWSDQSGSASGKHAKALLVP